MDLRPRIPAPTRVTHRVTSQPKFWLPPAIGETDVAGAGALTSSSHRNERPATIGNVSNAH